MVRTFASSGMVWDDGELPVCSFCGKNIDDVAGLNETPFSGELCCNDTGCRDSLLEQCLESEVEETTSENE